MNPLTFPLWPAVLAVVAFVAMMGAGLVFFVKALLRNAGGGWSRLLARFPAGGPPDGARLLEHQTIQVGRVVLKRCATVGIGPSGLYLGAPLHRPVLVPWGAIGSAAPTTLHWQGAHRLTVGGAESATITVKDDLFRPMRPHLGHVPAGEAAEAASR